MGPSFIKQYSHATLQNPLNLAKIKSVTECKLRSEYYLRIPDIAVDLELWAEPRNTAGMPFTLQGTSDVHYKSHDLHTCW